MSLIKKQVFRFLKWFNRPMRDEILTFRKDYEKLVGRYESLLKQISKYMKDHSFILNDEYATYLLAVLPQHRSSFAKLICQYDLLAVAIV